jgi:ABC-2 type transport system ATP-binding protein
MSASISQSADGRGARAIGDELAIDARGVGFRYGERQALSDVGFNVARTEIFGFLGPNGGGKSTLFKILSTLVPIQTGSISILGADLAGDTRAVRARIGVVFQNPGLDAKLRVDENLRCHGNLYGMSGAALSARIDALVTRLDLGDRASDLVETLSGGLKRRAELAKSLIHDPELLLLDEPSSGLDPAARREFWNYLAHLRATQAKTVVLTTHYMEEAERCDRIAILHRGQIVACAPPNELKARVGGDVVSIQAAEPESLKARVEEKFAVTAQIVDGSIRIERDRGHELVRDVVDAFGAEIQSVSFGRPTLEDAFVHLTGHRFFADAAREEDAG